MRRRCQGDSEVLIFKVNEVLGERSVRGRRKVEKPQCDEYSGEWKE